MKTVKDRMWTFTQISSGTQSINTYDFTKSHPILREVLLEGIGRMGINMKIASLESL